MRCDETAGKLFERRFVGALKTGIDGIDGHLGLFPGQVLEIAGPHAAGKTQLLMLVIWFYVMGLKFHFTF